VNTNLTKFEWTKTELKWEFSDRNNFNGKLVNTGKRLFTWSDENTLLDLKHVNWKIRKGPRVNFPGERVSSNLDRPRSIRRPWSLPVTTSASWPPPWALARPATMPAAVSSPEMLHHAIPVAKLWTKRTGWKRRKRRAHPGVSLGPRTSGEIGSRGRISVRFKRPWLVQLGLLGC